MERGEGGDMRREGGQCASMSTVLVYICIPYLLI